MRRLASIGLALLGLAMSAPTSVWADPPADGGAPTHKHPRGWLGQRKLCPECQSARLRAKEGINMPAPPPIPQGAVVMDGGTCTACQAGQGVVVSGPVPGHAMVSDAAPGYAVVNGQYPGADPSPIGMVQSRNVAQMPGRTDHSVMPTSIPPAPQVIAPPGSNRPHIISHVLGLSAIGRERREEAEKKRGQKHASIRYGEESEKINELPSSVVYGRRWW